MLKLSDWATNNGLDYETAYRLFRSGKFPRPVAQLPTRSGLKALEATEK
jgi:predicted site-specific integrase-resolvase